MTKKSDKKPHVEPSQEQKDVAAVRASAPEGDAKENDHAENLAAAPAPSEGEAALKAQAGLDDKTKQPPSFGSVGLGELKADEAGTVSVEVAPKTFATLQAIDRFAGIVKQVSENGWDMKEDLAPTMASLITDLGPAVQNFGEIGKEYQADKRKFINAIVIGLGGIASRWMK